jgi:hypothetical protein
MSDAPACHRDLEFGARLLAPAHCHATDAFAID